MTRDELFALPRERVGQFEFDEHVARVFPDMISRSVPGYASILSMIEQLAERFVRPATQVYDLGCSLGAATLLIRNQAPRDAVIHAVDNSSAMIERLRQRLRQRRDDAAGCDVQTHLADICEIEPQRASLVVLNFTLQFIPPERRGELLQRCFDGMLPGGALVLSEKICFDEPGQQQLLTELHLDFKRAHGYSELEIAQKRTSLENRLIAETLDAHCQRLRRVGFRQVAPWFQCFNFASILAIKLP
jgi:tRNA (cmo5U34)-methyltransferase